MDITIRCQLSLSKKLRALIQEGETRITLVAPSITDGRGEAKLILSSDKPINKSMGDFFGKETSIMIIPIETEATDINHSTVSSIFTKNVDIPTLNKKRTPVSKVGVWEEPEEDEVSYSIKTKDEIEEGIPEPLKVTKNPAYKRYVNSLEALDEAIKLAKDKSSDIDPNTIQDKRKRAEAIEIKEKMEAIDVDAYIVNDKCANLAINDLGINLVLNMPYNLANISARRILGSRDLKSMFNAKLVKFVKPEEVNSYVKKAEESIDNTSLEVFDIRGAEKNMEKSGMDVERMDLDIEDLDRPSDQEMLLSNFASRPPVRTSNDVTKSTHGNMSLTERRIPQVAKENPQGIKTIRRTR